jgi:hypothetical protein
VNRRGFLGKKAGKPRLGPRFGCREIEQAREHKAVFADKRGEFSKKGEAWPCKAMRP